MRSVLTLPYGHAGNLTASAWMNAGGGGIFAATRGYRMPAAGWIALHAAEGQISLSTSGNVTLQVLINDAIQTALNLVRQAADGNGAFSLSASAVRRAVPFAAGDRIHVFAQETGEMGWSDTVGYVLAVVDRMK
ncbi:MAG: hypothetical protein U0990_09415 [Candidatus Nanopelagicales bacterium]|nr:hypothetical protein [Candidatus Nanopelagicales bacterium]